jgi:hypothetical protein
MNWPSLLLAAAVSSCTVVSAQEERRLWFPPTPRSGLVDEIGALSEPDAAQLRGMLKEAVQRDDVRLVVFILKETPPVPPAELIKIVLARQKRCWFRGFICVCADASGPPIVGYDGPGTNDFPADELQRALETVRENASNETATGAQMLRYAADLLDEIHRLRVTHPPTPTTWAGQVVAWGSRSPTLSAGLIVGVAAAVALGLRIWRRHPSGLEFPVMPMPARLGGPYTGGSRVCANFDAATIARSHEHARR